MSYRNVQNVRGVPLARPQVQTYLLDQTLFPVGYIAERKEYQNKIDNIHSDRGGRPPKQGDSSAVLKNALSVLKAEGFYENPSVGYWRRTDKDATLTSSVKSTAEIEKTARKHKDIEIIFGKGSQSVYAWYFPKFKDASLFPMKIGRSDVSVPERVQDSVGYAPEPPKIALIFQTDYSVQYEKILHAILTIQHRRVKNAVGKEWFETNPEELQQIIEKIEAIIDALAPF